jgi:tetratricopeptide (TPR) repeat protein
LVEGLNLKQREIGSKRSYPELMDGVSGSQLQALALGVYSLYQRKAPTASVVIDKSPHNVKHIGLIKLLFPQAKIIAVKRDPRALLSSPHARQWLAKTSGEEIGNTDLAEALGKQLAQHNDLIRHWKKEFPESVTSVSFKDLTTQLQRVADTLLDFLGVPAGPRLPLEITTKWPEYTAKKLTSKRSTNQRELSSLLLATSTKTIEPSLSMVTLPEPGMLAFAYQLYQQGKYQDSERQCRRILRYLPDFAPAHYLLGELYLRSGLLELALSSLDIAIDLAPWKASQWGKNRLKAANLLQEYDSVRKVSLHGDDEFYKEVY